MASLHQSARARGARSAWGSGLSLPRRAVEVVELEVRGQTLLKPLPGGESLLPEPKPWGDFSEVASVGVWAPFVRHLSPLPPPLSHLPGILSLSHR